MSSLGKSHGRVRTQVAACLHGIRQRTALNDKQPCCQCPLYLINKLGEKGQKLVISLSADRHKSQSFPRYSNLLHTCEAIGGTNLHLPLISASTEGIWENKVPYSRVPRIETRFQRSCFPARDFLISYANSLLSLSDPQCNQFSYLTFKVFSI